MTRLDARLRIAIYGLAAGLIAAAFISGGLTRSAVPFFDAWDGGVAFLLSVNEDPRVLLAHHNEHRLVITKLLVWVDFHLFGGLDIFLVGTNYGFAFATWFALWTCLKSINGTDVAQRDLRLLGAVLLAWLLFWSQDLNFTWGFQNQVHVAQFFPLISFLLLSHSARKGPRTKTLFAAALVMGVISAGTMANGAIALTLMAAWGLILRLPVWRIAFLAVIGGLILFLYMSDFRTPPGHGTIFGTFLNHPFAMLVFVFEFLGNPFIYVFSPFGPGRVVAMLLGMILAAAAVYLTYTFIRRPPSDPNIAGLVLYIIYVGATAFLTAGGRLFTHEYASMLSRYTTPSIIAWAAFICIISPWIFRQFHRSEQFATGTLIFAVLGLTAMFIPFVRKAVPPSDYHQQQALAMLALELRVRDDQQIGLIYPRSQEVLNVADRATAVDLGVFKLPPYRGLRELIGTYWIASSAPACVGYLTETHSLENDHNHARVRGRIEPAARGSKRSRVLIIDENGMIVGAGLTEAPRRETQARGENIRTAPFTGYVPAASSGPFRFASQACRTT